MDKPKPPRTHLFSPHTHQCVYCGQSAKDDAVENTECITAETSVSCTACGGKGWLLANTGNDQSPQCQIQRCDCCQQFTSDLHAILVLQPALVGFVDRVASLKHEREDEDERNPFERASEDFIAEFNQLILDARKLLGLADKCDECGETVPSVIGCPDGSEVCQDCFDAGEGQS